MSHHKEHEGKSVSQPPPRPHQSEANKEYLKDHHLTVFLQGTQEGEAEEEEEEVGVLHDLPRQAPDNAPLKTRRHPKSGSQGEVPPEEQLAASSPHRPGQSGIKDVDENEDLAARFTKRHNGEGPLATIYTGRKEPKRLSRSHLGLRV